MSNKPPRRKRARLGSEDSANCPELSNSGSTSKDESSQDTCNFDLNNGDIAEGDEEESLEDEESEETVDDESEEDEDDDESEEDEEESEVENDEDDSERKVTMEYCAKELYTGRIRNIEGMLDGEPLVEFDVNNQWNLKKPDRNEPVFKNVKPKWGWKEELLLLESVEVCGLFNWERIAILLSRGASKFSAQEVRDHFFQYYFHGTLGQVWNYRLVDKPVLHIDHTEGDPVDEGASSKYLPSVSAQNLKSIKFLPHREEFEYPRDETEMMVTRLDFSSFYMENLKNLKIGNEVRALQLAIVDSYRRKVARRIAMRKFMKEYRLIEQFFLKEQQPFKARKSSCKLERDFEEIKKFIPLFDTATEFLDFYFNSVKEELLKLEITRLVKSLQQKKTKEKDYLQRDPEMKSKLENRAPDCYSVLTKMLFCTEQEGRKGSSSLREESGQGDTKWLKVHQVLLEGFQQQKILVKVKRMERNLFEDIDDLLSDRFGFSKDDILAIKQYLEKKWCSI